MAATRDSAAPTPPLKKRGSRKAAPAEPRETPAAAKAARGSARLPIAAREAIAAAAVDLGGVERLVAWVREDAKNESVFWASIYPKLIPLQLAGEEGGPVGIELVIRFV
ncbi:MAG: hypothetical protein QOH81_951 [Sphingomonadales bacterium]|nr:hypothetical protein [Sphingomonadales bacterium]